MSCKCKNTIQSFKGGSIPSDTIFDGNVQICGAGKSLNVSQIDGCSPTTIGSQSGCTSATTTVLIVSGKTNFSCDINTVGGGIFSGGTNILDIFTTVPGTDINVTGGTYSNTTGCATFTTNQGDDFDVCGFMTGFTNNFVTGGTFNSNVGVLTLTNNNGNTFDISGFTTTNTNPTFTGNTSATCINELWVSNISGCSPVTVGTELITEAGLKTDFIRYNSSADTMFIGSDDTSEGRIELRKLAGEIKIWSDGNLNLYGDDDNTKLLMSDVMSLEAQQHTFLSTSPDVRLKRTVASTDTSLSFVSPANVSSAKLHYKGVDSTFRIDTFNGITSEEALKIDLNQNVELSSNLNVSGNTNIAGDLSTRDITANDIILDTITPDKPSITLKRASVTGAKLELGFGGNDNGILNLYNFSGGTDILLQGGGISYFPQSLKIGVPYTFPETNPATLTVGGDILTSGNTNTIGTISSGGTNLDQLFAPMSATADTFVIAGTYIDSTGTISLLRNDGNFVNITGLTDTYVTGGTISTSATDSNNSGKIGLFYKNADGTPRLLPFEDTFTTGGTFTSSSGILSFTKNDGSSFTVSGLPTDSDFVWGDGSSGNFSIKQITDTTTDATNNYAVAQGYNTTASGVGSHAEGFGTISSGGYSHTEGFRTVASGDYSHTEGYQTTASTVSAHAEGSSTLASGLYSHAEGFGSRATGSYSHAEGVFSIASGTQSHAEGSSTTSSGNFSHSEGQQTIASGTSSHAEGTNTKAFGINSHSGGFASTASGNNSFIHSYNSVVSGDRSVVLGGLGITGTSDNTVYVPYLNIKYALPNSTTGTTGNTIVSLGIDENGSVVKQKNVIDVSLGLQQLSGVTVGYEFIPPINVPPNKYVKLTVHRVFVNGGQPFNGGMVFGYKSPTSTDYLLPSLNTNFVDEDTQFVYLNNLNPSPKFGLWFVSGTNPTTGNGTMKFRIEYEFFDL